MAAVIGPEALGGQALAQIVEQGGIADGQGAVRGRRLIHHAQDMVARVDFRVAARVLGYAEQPIQFRQQPAQGAAIPQRQEHPGWRRLHEPPGQFLPDPLRHQGVDFSGLHHAAHQGQGVVGDGEAGKAGGEAGHPEDADRVLGEGLGDVAQDSRRQVGAAAVGVHQAVPALGHGVDGQVPPAQVVFQGDIRAGVHHETPVARRGLPLRAGQGVFLVGIGMEKYGEIPAHRPEAQGLHVFRRGAHHDMVPIANGQPEEAVPDGATHDADPDVGREVHRLQRPARVRKCM